MQEISHALQKERTATEAFDKSWQPTAIEKNGLKRSKSKDTESIQDVQKKLVTEF